MDPSGRLGKKRTVKLFMYQISRSITGINVWEALASGCLHPQLNSKQSKIKHSPTMPNIPQMTLHGTISRTWCFSFFPVFVFLCFFLIRAFFFKLIVTLECLLPLCSLTLLLSLYVWCSMEKMCLDVSINSLKPKVCL